MLQRKGRTLKVGEVGRGEYKKVLQTDGIYWGKAWERSRGRVDVFEES